MWMAGIWFSAGSPDFSILRSIQTGSGGNPASYPMGTQNSYLMGRAASAWSWPLTSIKCQGQEWCSYISTPPYMSLAWCFIAFVSLIPELRTPCNHWIMGCIVAITSLDGMEKEISWLCQESNSDSPKVKSSLCLNHSWEWGYSSMHS